MAAQMVLDGFPAVSPYKELVAYEYLYSRNKATLKSVVEKTVHSNRLPTEAMDAEMSLFEDEDMEAIRSFIDSRLGTFSVAINSTTSWPKKLSDSANPVPVLYYRGSIGLIESKSVSVVGARNCTDNGRSRAFKAARRLAEQGITVVTGLARGIDTAAVEGAVKGEGKVIGVIGTPIDECYPKENLELQEWVERYGLLISQVPLYRYSIQHFKSKRRYFPERNELMAAVSDATIIIEASDTSGTLSQARACMQQRRPLFIAASCLENPSISWPARFLGKENVHVLESIDQVVDAIGRP